MAYHIRSISLPSRSHPVSQRVEESLNRFTEAEAPSSSSSQGTISILNDAMSGLVNLYESIEDFLQLPLTPQAMMRRGGEKWMDELLDGSLRLLDVCQITRDVLLQSKEAAQELHSSLRRRKTEIADYLSSRKQTRKQIEKCLKQLERIEAKSPFSSGMVKEESTQAVVVGTMMEARSRTISIFRSLLSSMKLANHGNSRRSLVCRWRRRSQIGCENEAEKLNVFSGVDASLHNLNGDKSSENAEKQLECLRSSITYLEGGLDSVFKSIIRVRVLVLNILSR